jgi:hypothetical protein
MPISNLSCHAIHLFCQSSFSRSPPRAQNRSNILSREVYILTKSTATTINNNKQQQSIMAFKSIKNIFAKSASTDESSVSSNGSFISRNDTSSFAFCSHPTIGKSDSSRSYSSSYSQRRAAGASSFRKTDWYAQKAAWKAHRRAEWETKHLMQAYDNQEMPQCTLKFSNVSAWNTVY